MSYPTLLPGNATPGELALEQVMAHVGNLPIDIRTVKNPDLCPLELLPWLAWEYAVTCWDTEWTEQQKRDVIKNAAAVNQHRGTPGAVKQALAAVDRQIDLVEWFNDTPPADPYTFRVIVYGNSITDAELQKISQQVTDAKNARSYLSDIRITDQAVSGQFYIGGACYVRQTVTLEAKTT
ncbi:phage tail protein I [Klebsiella aerogenes]